MGWKYDHVDYTELSTNGWEVHGTWSGQMVYYQYYLPKGLDITSLSYSWPPQGAGGEARPDLPRPVRHLEGRREPGARAQVASTSCTSRTTRSRTTPTRATSRTVLSLDKATALDKGYLPPSLDYTFVTEDMLPMGVTELELAPAVQPARTSRSTKKSRVARKDRRLGGRLVPPLVLAVLRRARHVWLLLFFVLPFYVILSVAFGGLDQIFLTADAGLQPAALDASVRSARWSAGSFTDGLDLSGDVRPDAGLRGDRDRPLPADRLPGRVLHRAARRTREDVASWWRSSRRSGSAT